MAINTIVFVKLYVYHYNIIDKWAFSFSANYIFYFENLKM